MNWLNLWIHVVAVFGAAYIVGHSQISLVPRVLLARTRVGLFFINLLECPACGAFHMGWLLTLFGHSLFSRTAQGALGAAFFYSGTSFILGRLTSLIPWPRQSHHFFTQNIEEKHVTEP